MIELEAEVVAIIRAWGAIILICKKEDHLHRVMTNPALTMLKVQVGHEIHVCGFEQKTILKLEEPSEIDGQATDNNDAEMTEAPRT